MTDDIPIATPAVERNSIRDHQLQARELLIAEKNKTAVALRVSRRPSLTLRRQTHEMPSSTPSRTAVAVKPSYAGVSANSIAMASFVPAMIEMSKP